MSPTEPPGRRDASPERPPRAAATVALLRPGPGGLEVLMIRRPASMAFAGGLHAFPGGAVDHADLVGLGDAVDGSTGDPPGGPAGDADAAFRRAAVRELAEEVGVRVEPGDLVPLGHWVTPPGQARRFDTRFFAAALPAGAVPAFSAAEVADHAWLTPDAALARLAAGEFAMLPPTSTTLEQLAPAGDLEDLRAWAPTPAPGPIVERLAPWLARIELGGAGAIPGRRANAWLVGRRAVVLVDPGDPSAAARGAILDALAAGGGTLSAVAITSGDPDHAAGIEGWALSHDVPVLAGPGAGERLSSHVRAVADGDRLPAGDVSLVVRAAMGPRPEHVAYLVDAADDASAGPAALIVGDLVGDDPGGLRRPTDAAARRRSLERLAGLGAARILPGHGPVLGPDGLESAIVSEGARRPAS